MTSTPRLLAVLATLALACSSGEDQAATHDASGSEPRLIERTVVLPSLHLEGMEEGMHGPDSVAQAVLHDDGSSQRIWLTSFGARLIDEGTGEVTEDYFCHVHMLPDGYEESYSKGRFVGVHAGGSSFSLPDGFALPVESSADEPVHFYGMSADYGKKGVPADVHYEIDLTYYTDADAQALGIQPLEFRFHKLKIDAPASGAEGEAHAQHGGHGSGDHGEHAGHGSGDHGGHGETPHVSSAPEQAGHDEHAGHGEHAGQGERAPELHAGHDHSKLGRMHFMVPPGRHEFRSPLKPWKAKGAGRRVHQVHFHVHPYAEFGEIWDKTEGRSLWKARAVTDAQKRIVSNVEQYSDSEGFFMPADHEYELVLAVDNPKDVPVDAMLTARIFYVEE